jgi:serine protease Do
MRRIAIVMTFSLCSGWAQAQTPDSSGTGFLVNEDGWLATNAHVVEGCDRLEVPGHGEVVTQHLDTTNDLAVLRIEIAQAVTPIVFRSTRVRLGEDIAAFGYPLSGLLSSSVKITTGNINSLVGLADDTRHLQISTPIQPGNSGGPVVDRTGTLVGVTVAQLGATFQQSTGIAAQNVNFAIRADLLANFLEARGIAFEESAEAGVDLNTADLAERISPAVVPIHCYGGPPPAAEAPPASTRAAPRSGLNYEYKQLDGYDVVGFDYETKPSVTYQQCLRACDEDRGCMAITYNEPARFCFLKNDAKILIRNADARAAYYAGLDDDVFISNFTVRSNSDMRGGDYAHIRNSTFIGCFLDCGRDDRCRAFAFVRSNNSCWLKDRTGTARRQTGVELGVK